MADDLGVVYTDKHLSDLEKALRRVYAQAEEEIGKKIDKFKQRTAELEEKKLAKVEAGTMTQDEFDAWKRGRAFYGDEWESQRSGIANVLANANETALKMLRGEQYDVFGFNSNYAAYEMEHGFGVNLDFSLYDKTTVERLLRDDPDILPFKRLDKIKDARWNFKNIKSQITQGILQGESIPKIAQRLASVVPNRNEKQMILHARTAMTAAQNGGRMERYKEAEALGINFKKVWLATLDSRTRDEHAELDGQEVDPDEDFKVDGYRIAYPGDPHADPAMVYNCRCTLITKLVDYPSHFDRRGKGKDGYENFGNITYNDWANEKAKNQVVSVGITKNEANALHAYTTSAYSGINSLIREGKLNEWPDAMDIVNKIDSAMDKSIVKDGIDLSRGSSFDELSSLFGHRSSWYEDPENLQSIVGKEVKCNQFLSTTKGTEAVKSYIRGVEWHYKTSDDVHGINIEKYANENVSGIEKELLVSRKTILEIEKIDFKVNDDGYVDGIVKIYAKLKGNK